MLSTLALFVVGVGVVLFRSRRGSMALNVNSDIVSRTSVFYCGLQCGSDNRLYKYPIHKGNCFCVSCGNVHLLYYFDGKARQCEPWIFG